MALPVLNTLPMATKMPSVGRIMRRPQHTFQLQYRPFTIQPFMLAPVLPGETMKNLLLQTRTVTDPINNKLCGWWLGHYFFYVKLRDLESSSAATDFTSMFLDEDADMSGYEQPAADQESWNVYTGGMKWVRYSLERIIDTYFRNEGESYSDYVITNADVDNEYACKITNESFIQSALDSTAYLVDDFNVDLDADTVVEASEVSESMRRWQMLVAQNMVEMSYEDFLQTYGVNVPEAKDDVPELLRYTENWTYPTNTVDPSDGSVASACSWSVKERADKDRFFREPGFIIGVTTCKPKVYLKNINGAGASWMNDAYSWLPAMLSDDWRTSIKQFANGAGPLPTVADVDGYKVDMKDLFIHGDQWVGAPMTTTNWNIVDLPDTTLSNRSYPSLTDCQNLFVGGTAATQMVRSDGVVRLSILGRQVDTTPGAPVD